MGQSRLGRDEAWLAALFRRHGAQIRAYARRRVEPDAVDDIVSEVFTAAWQHRQRVPEPELPWLYRTALHHTLHDRRGRRRATALTDRIISQDPPDRQPPDPIAGVAERLDAGAQVRHVMGLLAPRDAEVLRLWAWEQLAPAEIGDVLGCTAVAARVRLHRAKRRAERLLARREDDETAPTIAYTRQLPEENR